MRRHLPKPRHLPNRAILSSTSLVTRAIARIGALTTPAHFARPQAEMTPPFMHQENAAAHPQATARNLVPIARRHTLPCIGRRALLMGKLHQLMRRGAGFWDALGEARTEMRKGSGNCGTFPSRRGRSRQSRRAPTCRSPTCPRPTSLPKWSRKMPGAGPRRSTTNSRSQRGRELNEHTMLTTSRSGPRISPRTGPCSSSTRTWAI